MIDRLGYALIGSVFGALLALLGWWLYGIGMSPRLSGASMEPSASHWALTGAGVFAALGFVFEDRAGSMVGDVFAAIFNFEAYREDSMSLLQGVVMLAIIAAASFALWLKFA